MQEKIDTAGGWLYNEQVHMESIHMSVYYII